MCWNTSHPHLLIKSSFSTSMQIEMSALEYLPRKFQLCWLNQSKLYVLYDPVRLFSCFKWFYTLHPSVSEQSIPFSLLLNWKVANKKQTVKTSPLESLLLILASFAYSPLVAQWWVQFQSGHLIAMDLSFLIFLRLHVSRGRGYCFIPIASSRVTP